MWWRRLWTSVGSPSSWVTQLASETARTWWRERASAALGKGSAWKPLKVGLLLHCFAFMLIERNEDWCSNTCTGQECKRVFIAKYCIMYDLTEHIGLQTNAKWPWKQRKEEISHFCNVCPTPEFILMLVINTQCKHSQEVAQRRVPFPRCTVEKLIGEMNIQYQAIQHDNAYISAVRLKNRKQYPPWWSREGFKTSLEVPHRNSKLVKTWGINSKQRKHANGTENKETGQE